MKIEGEGIDAVAKVFQLHPSFHPRAYVDFRVEITGGDCARLTIGDCPALAEGDAYSWFAHLDAATHPALDAICRAVNPRCRVAALPGEPSLAFEIVIDAGAEASPEPAEVGMAKLSTGAGIVFERRREIRR
jgi:hypothetical protein